MLIKGDMYARIGRGRQQIPTICSDLKIGIHVFCGFQTHIKAGTSFQGEEIQRTAIHAEHAQVVTQHQRNLSIMQAQTIGIVIVFVHFLVGRMRP